MSQRIALVTGASRGLGRAISVELARDGMLVIVNYRKDAEGAAKTEHEIAAVGGHCRLAQFDIADAEQVRTAIRGIDREIGLIDVLVNNAAVGTLKPLLRVKDADVQETLQVNLAGMIYCTREVVKSWIGGRVGSRIINLTSSGAESGSRDSSVYCTTKAGVIGLTKSLACELGRKNVTVNCISPGLFPTESVALNGVDSEAVVSRTPLGRAGRLEEVGYLASFLASDRAAFITGQVIRINGGVYL
ncbi:MAG: SDR family oxidoreductase [Planctomycetaceae bacterium]|nr:SDR family oxidoreductase [Planctomycetaceae bacterium]